MGSVGKLVEEYYYSNIIMMGLLPLEGPPTQEWREGHSSPLFTTKSSQLYTVLLTAAYYENSGV